jgi:hypothetical protein
MRERSVFSSGEWPERASSTIATHTPRRCKISATAPCTNHLMECALCQPEQNEQHPVCWSYNLQVHHQIEHNSHPLPVAARMTDEEKALVKAVGGEKRALCVAEEAILRKAQARQAVEVALEGEIGSKGKGLGGRGGKKRARAE